MFKMNFEKKDVESYFTKYCYSSGPATQRVGEKEEKGGVKGRIPFPWGLDQYCCMSKNA